MRLEVEDRLRRYGDTFEQAVAATESTPRRVEHTAVRRQPLGRWLVAATILIGIAVAAVVAFPRGDGDSPKVTSPGSESGLTRYRDDSQGFSLEYPSSWHRAPSALMSDNSEATELVSIGTYDLPVGSTTCFGGPQNALDALPAGGALVSVQQRTDYIFAPGRVTYPPTDPFAREDQPLVCLVGSGYEHWVVTFADHNRSIRVLVAFGAEATTATKDAAWRAVNSLQFDAAPPSAIPNHVTPDLYAAQALGATAVVNLPEGPYETAVREGDNICIDLRPSGAPSGPRFCSIPANAPWPQPVLASVVSLNGANYIIGVAAADTVTQVNLDGTAVALSARQAFPTLRFFAAPVSGTPAITAATSGGTISITPTVP